MIARLACIVVVVCLAGVARADRAADALLHMDKGVELFKADKVPEARAEFLQARDLVPEKANPYRWLGLSDARLGRCADAVADLQVFLERVPADDPRRAESVTLRDRCKSELATRAGAIVVETSPPGAELLLDDDETAPPVGVTPYRLDGVTEGEHVLILRKAGYDKIRKSVAVGRNETVRLDLVLRAIPPPSLVAPPAPAPPPRKRWPIWVGVAAGVVVAGAVVAVTVAATAPPSEMILPAHHSPVP